MPRETLTLVRKLISELSSLSDSELDELIDVVELATVEAMAEVERRQLERETVKKTLRLIVNEMDD